MLDQSTIAMFRSMQSPGKPSLLVELIDLYLQHSPPRVTDAQAAFEERNIQKLKHAVHTLKGSSQNLGATDVGNVCKDIEELLLTQDWGSIESKMPLLQKSFTIACDEFAALREKELQK